MKGNCLETQPERSESQLHRLRQFVFSARRAPDLFARAKDSSAETPAVHAYEHFSIAGPFGHLIGLLDDSLQVSRRADLQQRITAHPFARNFTFPHQSVALECRQSRLAKRP